MPVRLESPPKPSAPGDSVSWSIRLARHGVPCFCLGAFSAIWIALSIAPRYRVDWLLESIPTLIIVPALVLTYRRRRFSDRAYLQGTALLILHTIGSHYTYSEVPLGERLQEALGWSRNHYDRIVHFAFGLLALRVLLELGRGRRSAGEVRPMDLYLAFAQVGLWSALYEIIEWLVASLVDPTAGAAFLGSQGDPWDAQKDMGLAILGGILGVALEVVLAARTARSMSTREPISSRAPPRAPEIRRPPIQKGFARSWSAPPALGVSISRRASRRSGA